MEIITNSASETAKAGEELSADLALGDVVALSGDLGAGKTTFIQGVAKGLSIKSRITSPTFIIMRSYESMIHVDLYRLDENIKKEIENLGLLNIIKERKHIVIIEWAEKAKELLPKHTLWINMIYIDENKRKIVVNR